MSQSEGVELPPTRQTEDAGEAKQSSKQPGAPRTPCKDAHPVLGDVVITIDGVCKSFQLPKRKEAVHALKGMVLGDWGCTCVCCVCRQSFTLVLIDHATLLPLHYYTTPQASL
jgi:hypothetical protein